MTCGNAQYVLVSETTRNISVYLKIDNFRSCLLRASEPDMQEEVAAICVTIHIQSTVPRQISLQQGVLDSDYMSLVRVSTKSAPRDE